MPAEQNYDIPNKELLIIVTALQYWRIYMEGAPQMIVYTDHKNLISFTTIKILNRRQIRWSELLGQYKFKIQYISNKKNGRIDALNKKNNYMD